MIVLVAVDIAREYALRHGNFMIVLVAVDIAREYALLSGMGTS